MRVETCREKLVKMGYKRNVGKYQLGHLIGEGTFAKVKFAKNIINGQNVAIKILDKKMIIANNNMDQVKREIRIMRVLNHPNIVRIHEVIATKARIYIIMEYISGGELSDKLSYAKRLSEKQARKYFQQLIDAVDYCHCRGVYHRDMKPQNLLLDRKGNLKVLDFGLSILDKPGSLLSTACGSPDYVAPELLRNKDYEGAGADVWACGVILFEMLAGYLPFDDTNILNLYRKIYNVKYKFPQWFTPSQKKLIKRIFNADPDKRITMAEITEDEWFLIDYEPAVGKEFERKDNEDNIGAAFNSIEEGYVDTMIPQTPVFINAFQLISVSHILDFSSLFEEQDDNNHRTILGSKYSISETIEKIEAAAKDASFSVERINNTKIKMQAKVKSKCRSSFNLLAEVTIVAPTDCFVEISKSAGDLGLYQEFCRSLSSLLSEKSTKELSMDHNATSEDEMKSCSSLS